MIGRDENDTLSKLRLAKRHGHGIVYPCLKVNEYYFRISMRFYMEESFLVWGFFLFRQREEDERDVNIVNDSMHGEYLMKQGRKSFESTVSEEDSCVPKWFEIGSAGETNNIVTSIVDKVSFRTVFKL